MRVLVVHNNYREPGGETAVYHAETALLLQHAHTVSTWRRDSVEIDGYNQVQKAALIINTLYNNRTYRELKAFIRTKRPDVAHVHNVFPLLSPSVYRALHDAGLPIVQTIHNFRLLCPNGLFYTNGQVCERCKTGNTSHAVRYKCFRNSRVLSAIYALSIGLHRRWGTFGLIDHFIALTEFSAHKFVESGLTTADKITILGNFLPDPLPAPGSFEKREPYIAYLGRLSIEKGVYILLDAITGIPGLGLKIAGDGPQAETLQTKARQKDIGGIEFLGYVAGENKRDLLTHAMATIVPSVWYENFPVAVLESLAVGTPIVASNLGCLPFIVAEGKNGRLFRPGDIQDLHEKLTWLAEHPAELLRMGQCGRQTVETKYSAGVHYQALISIYKQLRNKHMM
jgi:glycosyltransferase involved in cell wall biosynthesis